MNDRAWIVCGVVLSWCCGMKYEDCALGLEYMYIMSTNDDGTRRWSNSLRCWTVRVMECRAGRWWW